MDEADEHPAGDQLGLRGDDAVVEVENVCRFGVMTRDRVVGQAAQQIGVAERGGVLERAHPEVAGRDPREYRAGFERLARDPLPGDDHGQRPARGNAERVHRLADHVLAQHRPDHGLTVPAARERRAAGALEVQVAPLTAGVDELAQQQRPAVPQPRRVAAELVAGVRLRDGLGAGGERVTDQHPDAVVGAQRLGVGAELGRQVVVERQQPGRGRLGRLPRHVETLELAHEGVVEREQGWGGDAHRPPG